MWPPSSLPVLALLASTLPLTVTAWSAPDVNNRRQTGPTVEIQNGTVIGASYLGADTFKGIPFAKPPVGDLRLRAPQPITEKFKSGIFDATKSPTSCPQFQKEVNTGNIPGDAVGMLLNSPVFQNIFDAGEDCLTINVVRPSTATAGDKLPVLFWIFGGGFSHGAAPIFPGSSLVLRSVKLGEPIIFVSVNYRLGGFGFLAGDELADEGNTNLGLRDQRLGMQWVQENIEAFGGDPSKVTIWGESAGAVSVCDHTLINKGDNTYNGRPLFRGAIMNSGSIFPAEDVRTGKANDIYRTVVESANCSSASNTLSCLRALDYTTFLNAVTSVPSFFGYRSVDLTYLPRPDPDDPAFFSMSPEISMKSGAFTKVPVIIGDQEDEGTVVALAQSNLTTNAAVQEYLESYFPTNPTAASDVAALLAEYPDQPLGQPEGSPFRTGILWNLYPQYKRLAAILGDLTFTLTRRIYLKSLATSNIPAWSYLASYLHAVPTLGTFHASDLIFAFGILPGPVTDTIQTHYISFVNHLDPNRYEPSGTMITWPRWNESDPKLLHQLALSNDVIGDDFRQGAFEVLERNLEAYRR